MKRPVITLLTDFGLADHYVGVMKGVMLGICPDAALVDITHEISAFAVSEAAWTLAETWNCFPPGTVHLVVVDPGVGSPRRPILAEAGGHFFVAPDNGVLSGVLDSAPNSRVREVTAAAYFRQPVSRTFHGRDIFAPVAAHLAAGIAPSRFGRPIADCARLAVTVPVQTGPYEWSGVISKIDKFGNLITDFDSQTWACLSIRPFRLRVGSSSVSRMVTSYAEIGPAEVCAIEGSAGFLEISAREKNTARVLNVKPGDPVLLSID